MQLHNIESIGLKTIFYFLYGNKRDHTLVMDLTSLYSDFVMDGREVLFRTTIWRLDGALYDGIPLMTVEMFSRPTGGVQSVLDVANRPK